MEIIIIHYLSIKGDPNGSTAYQYFPLFQGKCKCHMHNCVWGVWGCVCFVCNLDNFLLKNVIVFFSWKSNFKKSAHLKKKAIFDLLFTSLQSSGNRHTNSFSAYPTYIEKNHTQFLFGMNHGVGLSSHQFRSSN